MHGRQEGCVETKGEGGSMADKRNVLRQRERGDAWYRQEGCVETKGEGGCMADKRERRDAWRQRERGTNKGGMSCSVVIISKPQTESSLIPRPSFHGSLCSTEYCIAGNFRWSKF